MREPFNGPFAHLIPLLTVIVFCSVALSVADARVYASDVKPKPSLDMEAFDGGEPSRFHFSTGMYVSTGFIGSKNNSIASRTVNSATGFIQFGHESGYLTPFLIAEYSGAVQATDSARVSGTNMGGAGYGVGAGLEVAAFGYFFSAAYQPFGGFDLASKTAAGSQVSYSDPSIWMLSLGYKFDSLSVFLVQKFAEFSKSTTGSVTTSLGDDKLLHASTGGGIEWTF